MLPRFLTLPPMIWFVELNYKIVAANRNFISRFVFNRDEQGNLQTHCSLPQKTSANKINAAIIYQQKWTNFAHLCFKFFSRN